MKSWFACVLFCLAALSARAALGQRDMVAEARIEAELARIDASLVTDFRNARVAYDNKDYATAERLSRMVVERAPSFDVGLRRLGSAIVMQGRNNEGVKWVEKAVALNRSSANLSTLAWVLSSPVGREAARDDLKRAFSLIREALTLPEGDDVATLFFAAQLALRVQDIDAARGLVAGLERRAPDEMYTHYLAAILAANDGHWVKADREIGRAGKLGLDAKTVAEFRDSGVASRARAWWWIGATSWTVAVWAAGLSVLCASGYILSRATLRQIERSDPNVPITPGEQRLRRIYRAVLNVAGIYYYISLPVILVLVVAVAGGVIFGFMLAGWLPIKLIILLVIGAIATIYSLGKSLLVRVKSEDPGRALSRAEAEGLWRLAEEVAATLNTRPIDEIRIAPGTDLCVYERGSWREKMENRAHRVLVIGAAVLNDFKQQDFQSVLAHEYGHFANRDTAGGDVALRVRNDMFKFYLAMLQAGQATWLNVAFHFLRFYNFIFRRISHGATRLQEVLADRVAAQAYGPAAFEGGLRHAIRRSLEFDFHADREIKAAIEAKRPVSNLYESRGERSDTVEQEFAKAMASATTEDDTHPAPQDRFRLISRIAAPSAVPATGLVWELFRDPAAVHSEMMETVEKNIARHRG